MKMDIVAWQNRYISGVVAVCINMSAILLTVWLYAAFLKWVLA